MLKPITLTGEQKKVLFLPEKDPIQIKGVAGSGKTSIALYRAKHLVDTYKTIFQEPNVAIFTFTTSLVKYISDLLPFIVGGYQKDNDEFINITKGLNVKVFTVHSYAYQFLKAHGFWNKYSIIGNKDKSNLIQKIISKEKINRHTEKILNKKNIFFEDEFSWIKGKMFTIKEDYINAPRLGRGIQDKVTKADKELIWDCFALYNKELHNSGRVDFEDFAIAAFNYITRNKSFNPPFSHIIIDEAQDLSKAQVYFLKELVSKDTNSLTLIADSAQRIYKSGFSWSEVGINVVGGRTTILKKNYRNPKEIALAAISLLDKENDRSDFTETDMSSFTRTGEKPVISYFDSYKGQNAYLISEIKKIDLSKCSVVILHRCRSDLYRIQFLLKNNEIPCEVINGDFNNFSFNTVKICTLPSIKGLEFDYVFIIDANENNLPLPIGLTGDDDDLHISTERRLLYTAMTRAKERLIITTSGKPSRFINEISESSIVKIGKDSTKIQEKFVF